VLSVVSAAFVAMQRCGKHICAAVNQHATIEEAVFSVRGADTINRGSQTTRIRLDGVSGVSSWQNNREEMTGTELGCAKKTS
jgi:hypothetical protein